MHRHCPCRRAGGKGDELSEINLFDVVAVNIETKGRRLLDRAKTKEDAEASMMFAVVRRGVETEFYMVVPHPSGVQP